MKQQAKPTASVRRVDVSARERASASPADPEAMLFRAYGSVGEGQLGVFKVAARSESCICGGTLDLTGDAVVEQIVQAHNESALHKAWRAWREARDGKSAA